MRSVYPSPVRSYRQFEWPNSIGYFCSRDIDLIFFFTLETGLVNKSDSILVVSYLGCPLQRIQTSKYLCLCCYLNCAVLKLCIVFFVHVSCNFISCIDWMRLFVGLIMERRILKMLWRDFEGCCLGTEDTYQCVRLKKCFTKRYSISFNWEFYLPLGLYVSSNQLRQCESNQILRVTSNLISRGFLPKINFQC